MTDSDTSGDDLVVMAGMDWLSDVEKSRFLSDIEDELQLRVGTRLSEGLSGDRMAEFEAFVEGDQVVAKDWFAKHLPDFESTERFQAFVVSNGDDMERHRLLCEYASLCWLEVNQPDYRRVVQEMRDALRREVLTRLEHNSSEPLTASR